MANFARFLFAVALLPLAWGLTLTFLDVVRLMPVPDGWLMPPGLVAVLAGVAVFLLFAVACPLPVRLYVLGHELTHAVWGLLFGARVSNLKVGLRGGSVTLTKSNVWITLAPYFFPFYTILLVLVALAVRAYWAHLPCPLAWQFAVGATWCFHCVFTLRSLAQEQPDIQEYGHVFSYVLIWIFNVLGVAVWIVCTAEISWPVFVRHLLTRSVDAYAAIWTGCAGLYESVRTLPVLQR